MGLDCIAIACAELASISERRTERLVNPSLSDGLPPFLVAREEGLNSGFMITQYVAAALVSENKALSYPGSVDSIPTSAGQEDHVSMGNGSGLKALQVVGNAERVLAIELLAGAQAVEFLAPLEPGIGARAARSFVRTLSERVREDRSLSADIERVATAIRDGSLVDAIARTSPEARRERPAASVAPVPRLRDPPRDPRARDPHRRGRSRAAIFSRRSSSRSAYFVVATGWSWFRFRQRESRKAQAASPTSNGSKPS